jgi:protein-S-isoprenylcysteine O-methyltransferase Ste14
VAEPETDHPRVIAFPPLLFASTLVAGWLLHLAFPHRLLPPLLARLLGVALVVIAFMLGSSARRAIVRVGTNVDPREPTLAIVTDGPFRYTRNPLYLSLVLFCLGGTLLIDGVAPLVVLVPALLVLHFGIVLREERYLEDKFGDVYRAYRVVVRRDL